MRLPNTLFPNLFLYRETLAAYGARLFGTSAMKLHSLPTASIERNATRDFAGRVFAGASWQGAPRTSGKSAIGGRPAIANANSYRDFSRNQKTIASPQA